MKSLDIIVVGGGIVGLSAALMAARQGLQVALVEAHAPKAWQREQPDLRVVALALDNQALIDSFGLWQNVLARRAFPYSAMTVFDAVHSSPLRFNAGDLGRPFLGHILENDVLVEVLWQAVIQEPNIHLHCPDKIGSLHETESEVHISLQSGVEFSARLAIGADGASSRVRDLLGIGVDEQDYGQKGVVAFVHTELGHQNTAWQRFLNTGPLALLPFGDHCCSIVWSLPQAEADRLLQTKPKAFCHALDSAFAGTLGKTRLVSERAAFPLRRRLAKCMIQSRTLLLGDAAHAVHPLAGQGVNLGLRDVRALRDALTLSKQKTGDALDGAQFARWARTRYSENTVAALAFENINCVFSNDNMALSLLRGRLLGLGDRITLMKNAMARYAAGL